MRLALAAAFLLITSLPAAAQPQRAQTPAAPQRVERGALLLENVPETPPEVSERLQQYVNTRGATFLDWLPGGAMLIGTRFGDTVQAHRVAAPLRDRTQLTFYAEPIASAETLEGASRDDFYFTRGTGGDEQYQIFLYSGATGRAIRYTEPNTRNESLVQTRDGSRIAWALAPRDSGDYDIYIANRGDSTTRRKIIDGEGALAPVAFSPSGNRLLLARYISIAETRLFIYDMENEGLTPVAGDVRAAYGSGAFIDDHSIIVTSDEGSQFLRLTRIDLPTGVRTPVGPAHNWDVEEIELSRDGRTLAYVVNEAGAATLHLYDLQRGRVIAAPELPPGLVFSLAFDDAGQNLGFTLNSAASPSDAYSYDLRRRRLTRWTESEVGGLDRTRFVTPELVEWRSFDGRMISGFLYRPTTPGPHPVIVDIHGGPESQYRPAFNSRIQYWVNELGVAVIAPNVRGSSGYGRDFLALDNAEKREDSVRDIGALLDWIAADANLDESRVIAYGGSYGGYMVLASMTHYNDRFAGAVDIVGISNWVSFLENTSAYRRDLRRAEYGDERVPEMRAALVRMSPLTNISRITKPIFVIHGANDPRVPLSEAEQVLAAVRRNGGETWTMIARNEGHGFARRENQEAQRAAETLFFRRVLRLP